MKTKNEEVGVHPDSQQLAGMISEIMRTGQYRNGLCSLPLLLLPRQWLPHQEQGSEALPIAECVLRWFWKNGFLGERTRKNIHGYPGLFRELLEPPPWVDEEPEDCDGDVTKDRAEELRPLYLQCAEHGFKLIEVHKVHAEEQMNSPLLSYLLEGASEGMTSEMRKVLVSSQLASLGEKIGLVQTLGSDRVPELYKAVFDFYPDLGWEDFEARSGAPDLFIWHPDTTRRIWFFAEVKGENDHLRASQADWIRCHWDSIEGRVLLISVVGANG